MNHYPLHRSSFNSLPNATRPSRHHPTPSSALPSTNPTMYRDPTYPPPPGLVSPTMQPAYLDGLRPSYDYGANPSFTLVDPYLSKPHPVNGMHMSSQTPYGPHIATNGIGGGQHLVAVAGASTVGPSSGGGQEDISTIFVVGFPDDMQEREFQNMFTFSSGFEAATLKIPNKEYTAYGLSNNPNPPSLAALSSLASRPGATNHYAGSNDPYNIVTMNQGGVVVDGGRDGTMTSWPAAADDTFYGGPGGIGSAGGPAATSANSGPGISGGPVPPRKQIIGFAKFRTRAEALDARDLLQGKRVDIEKGSVLKAEMAKKNLHTKRGVAGPGSGPNGPAGSGGSNNGPVNGMGSGGGGGGMGSGMPSGSLGGALGHSFNPMQQYDPYGTMEGVLSARERELGTLGAMGLSGAGVPVNKTWQEEEEKERERRVINAMGLSSGDESSGPGPRDRRRKDTRDKELRLTSGSAYDAFHSVPAHISSSFAAGSPPLESIFSMNALGMTHAGAASTGLASGTAQDDATYGPWDHVHAQRQQPLSKKTNSSRASSVAGRSTRSTVSQQHQERPSSDAQSDAASDVHTNPELEDSNGVDPNATATEINVGQLSSSFEHLALNMGSSQPTTQNGTDSQGNTSPQLPSPSSGSGHSASGVSTSAHSTGGVSVISAPSSSSSGGMRHTSFPNNCVPSSSLLGVSPNHNATGVDQNPPINTLYVGNLPISPPPPGYPPDILEDSLRELFRSRPGFRRLSFKQKSSGPMCFVEFEDVHAATKTINELYGNTLNGLVKGGGIRLSYSKNPLGVRTPTSANGPGPALQQQHILQIQGPNHNHGHHQNQGKEGERDRFSVYGAGGVQQALSPAPHHNHSNFGHTHGYMISPPPPRFTAAASASSSATAGGAAGAGGGMLFGNFPTGAPAPSGGSNGFLFGTAGPLPSASGTGSGVGVGYRLSSSDVYLPSSAASGASSQNLFAPFDVGAGAGHLEHPQLPLHSQVMQHQHSVLPPLHPSQYQSPNQNQNF